jgi:hypothetical protein
MKEKLDFKELAVGLFEKELQYHVLKHFKTVDDSYIDKLCEHEICTREQVIERLKRSGSNFNSSWVANPEELVKALFLKLKAIDPDVEWIDNRCELELEFDKDEFPDGIGTDNLIPLDDLSDSEKASLKDQEEDTITLKTVVKTPPHTWKIQLIMVRDATEIDVLTIFPGKYAPILPDPVIQNVENYEVSKNFWENHVVMVENE